MVLFYVYFFILRQIKLTRRRRRRETFNFSFFLKTCAIFLFTANRTRNVTLPLHGHPDVTRASTRERTWRRSWKPSWRVFLGLKHRRRRESVSSLKRRRRYSSQAGAGTGVTYTRIPKESAKEPVYSFLKHGCSDTPIDNSKLSVCVYRWFLLPSDSQYRGSLSPRADGVSAMGV